MVNRRSYFARTRTNLAIEQAIEFSQSHLAQIQNRAFSIAASNPIARILNQGYDIERDLEAVRYTVRQLGDLEGAVPDRYLVAVYCYSGHDDTVVTSSGFVGSGIFPHRATAEHVLRTQKYLIWHPVPPAEAGVASAAACRALLQSDKLVKEIAYDEGFGGKQNLIRSFKKAVGMTPTEYRRRHSGARIANHDT